MAEIGVVASILGVATFGTQVATQLYKFCDDFRNAPRQIRQFARKVTNLADALQHTRETFKSHRGSYNKEAEKRVAIILRSCKADLQEIDGTLKFKRAARLTWLFKKAKADELFRSLESQASTLQVLTQGVMLSKVLQEQESSNDRSKRQDEELRNLITTMENLTRTNQDLLSELKIAERKATAAQPDVPPAPPEFSRSSRGPPKQDITTTALDGKDIVEDTEPSLTSDLLLQVVPWTDASRLDDLSGDINSLQLHNTSSRRDGDAMAMVQGTMRPYDLIRFIMERYTSAPTELLDEYYDTQSLDPSLPTASPDSRAPDPVESLDEDPDSGDTDLSSEDGSFQKGVFHAFDSTTFAGIDFIDSLGRTRGSFMWMQGNDQEVACFCGRRKFFVFRLTATDDKPMPYSFTRISKSWVGKHELRRCGLHFCEVRGYYHIFRAVSFDTIQDMVLNSATALGQEMQWYARNRPSGTLVSRPDLWPGPDAEAHSASYSTNNETPRRPYTSGGSLFDFDSPRIWGEFREVRPYERDPGAHPYRGTFESSDSTAKYKAPPPPHSGRTYRSPRRPLPTREKRYTRSPSPIRTPRVYDTRFTEPMDTFAEFTRDSSQIPDDREDDRFASYSQAPRPVNETRDTHFTDPGDIFAEFMRGYSKANDNDKDDMAASPNAARGKDVPASGSENTRTDGRTYDRRSNVKGTTSRDKGFGDVPSKKKPAKRDSSRQRKGGKRSGFLYGDIPTA